MTTTTKPEPMSATIIQLPTQPSPPVRDKPSRVDLATAIRAHAERAADEATCPAVEQPALFPMPAAVEQPTLFERIANIRAPRPPAVAPGAALGPIATPPTGDSPNWPAPTSTVAVVDIVGTVEANEATNLFEAEALAARQARLVRQVGGTGNDRVQAPRGQQNVPHMEAAEQTETFEPVKSQRVVYEVAVLAST